MRIQSLMLVSLLAGMYGCQPEAPVQETAPVETISSESAAPVAAAVAETAPAVDAAVSAVAEVAPVVATKAAEVVAVAKTVAPAKVEAVAAKVAPVAIKVAPVAEKAAKAVAAAKTPAAVPMKEMAAVVATPEVAAVVAKPAAPAMVAAPASVNGCKACHNIDSDKKKVGPGWVAVAHKYAGDAKGAETVAAHIMAGGKFDWKFGMMPPKGGNSKLTDADAKELATYILGLK